MCRLTVYVCAASHDYPLVGGTGQRHFDGTRFEPRNCLKTRRLLPAHSKPAEGECTPRSVPEGVLPEWGCVGQRLRFGDDR